MLTTYSACGYSPVGGARFSWARSRTSSGSSGEYASEISCELASALAAHQASYSRVAAMCRLRPARSSKVSTDLLCLADRLVRARR